jgi:hypothetical protein
MRDASEILDQLRGMSHELRERYHIRSIVPGFAGTQMIPRLYSIILPKDTTIGSSDGSRFGIIFPGNGLDAEKWLSKISKKILRKQNNSHIFSKTGIGYSVRMLPGHLPFPAKKEKFS